jgi:hypothetical protein
MKREGIKTYLDELYSLHYREKPVPVEVFVRDTYYLGKATNKGRVIYPIWMEALKTIFRDDSKTQVVLTGAIGTGKTTIAIIAVAYVLYNLLCLKNAWEYFGKPSTGQMGVSFFNLTKSLGESRGFAKLQAFLLSSPWFLRAAMPQPKTKSGVQYLEFPLLRYILASPYAKGFGTIGEDVIAGIMDEVDSPTESAKQKARVLKAYEATVRRFESRFTIQGLSIGRLFLVASKQEELSFINTFIAQMKNSDKVLIFDIPLWEAQPRHYFSGARFNVAVGDAFHKPMILDEGENVREVVEKGYEIIDVPVEFKEEFERDLIGALRDLAGISVAGVRRRKLFASELFIKECFDKTKVDPITLPTVLIGLNDDVELIWYIEHQRFRMGRDVVRYMHWDISVSGDASGISMCGIKEWRMVDIENQDGTYRKQKVPVIETDFVLRVKAKEGDRIPLHKVRKMVLDLKALGYTIKFSADLKLMSEDTTQLLQKAGISVRYLSVDRTDKPYVNWRNLVYEKRWIMHPHAMTLFEAKHLEHDHEKGKVDHPNEVRDIEVLEEGDIKEVVMLGSKDCTDAIVGAIENCVTDSNVPMDVQSMKGILKKVAEGLEERQTPVLPMKDASGREIIGVKEGDNVKKLSSLIKKLRK